MTPQAYNHKGCKNLQAGPEKSSSKTFTKGKRDIILFLDDILESINDIQESVKSLSKEEVLDNKDKKDATMRRLEVIGEAVKNIPDSFRKKYPKISWRDIAGFRDVIIHAYFGVDFERVWMIVKDDIPKLKKEIEKILEKEKDLEDN